MQYSYALSEDIHRSAGMVFPFHKEMLKTFSVGGKYNYIHSGPLASALTLSYHVDKGYILGANVLSFGDMDASVHLYTGAFYKTQKKETTAVFGLGGIKSFSTRVSGMMEIIYVDPLYDRKPKESFLNEGRDLVATIGIRLKGDKVSWDFGTFRSLLKYWDGGFDEDFVLFSPTLKATVLF